MTQTHDIDTDMPEVPETIQEQFETNTELCGFDLRAYGNTIFTYVRTVQ